MNGEMMTLLEAMRVLGLRRADLEPGILQRTLQARLETAQFEEIPRLLTAYRTITRVLDQVPSLHVRASERGANPTAGEGNRLSKSTREEEPMLVLDDAIITSVVVLPRPAHESAPARSWVPRGPFVLLGSIAAIALGSAIWAFWPSKPAPGGNATTPTPASSPSLQAVAKPAKPAPSVTLERPTTPTAKSTPQAVRPTKPAQSAPIRQTPKPTVAIPMPRPGSSLAKRPTVARVPVERRQVTPSPRVAIQVRISPRSARATKPVVPANSVIARKPSSPARPRKPVTVRREPVKAIPRVTANAPAPRASVTPAARKPATPVTQPAGTSSTPTNQIISSSPSAAATANTGTGPASTGSGRRAALPRHLSQPRSLSLPDDPAPEPASIPDASPEPVVAAAAPAPVSSEHTAQRYFNERLFDLWQRSGATLRYGTWTDIPLDIQILESASFREAVYLIAPATIEPKDLERPN